MSILVLKLTLLRGAHAYEPWEGVIEIDGSATLQNLHHAIQKAVDFDNHHLYDFWIARTATSRDRIKFDGEIGDDYEKPIANLYPMPEKRHLFYLFDYGDNWLFKITKVNRGAVAADPTVKYPRLVSETGTRPVQHPDWDA